MRQTRKREDLVQTLVDVAEVIGVRIATMIRSKPA